MRRNLRACAVLAVVVGGLTLATSASAAEVDVVDSLRTVKPKGAPGGSSGARISAARNEFESFQVAISAGNAPLRGVNVSLTSPLTGSRGSIPARNVTIYREAYLDIDTPSDLEGSRGRRPDALIPKVDPFYGERRDAFPLNVPAGENRVAWVDVLVPADQPAGDYAGSLRVTANGGFSRAVPIALEVHPFGIPSTSSLQSAFGIDWEVCTAHYGNDCIQNEERGWALKSLYVRAGLDDRVTISYAEYQPPIPGRESAWFRQYILPLLEGRTPQNDARSWLPMRLRGARMTSIQVDGDSYLDDWKREAKAGGFASRAFLYACDEPNTDADTWRYCKREARAGRQRWPGLDVLITSTLRNANRFDATGLIDILVPIVNEMHDKPGIGSPYAGNQRPKYDSFVAQPGNRLWLYTSCMSHGCSGDPGDDPYWAGWPSYVVDQPASEHRAMGFVSYQYRASGELYFATDYDLDTAWTDQFSFGGNGDGTLFYPGTPERIGGKHDIPVDSIRLKRIRDGREDYEYLRILDRRGERAAAMRVAGDLFPTLYRTEVSASRFQGARARLAAMIVATQ